MGLPRGRRSVRAVGACPAHRRGVAFDVSLFNADLHVLPPAGLPPDYCGLSGAISMTAPVESSDHALFRVADEKRLSAG